MSEARKTPTPERTTTPPLGVGVQRQVIEPEVESLFRDRVPEAAARQLAVVLAWAAECQLATYERYKSMNSMAASQRDRHREIADTLVRHCHELGVEPVGLRGRPCPRLAGRLEAL